MVTMEFHVSRFCLEVTKKPRQLSLHKSKEGSLWTYTNSYNQELSWNHWVHKPTLSMAIGLISAPRSAILTHSLLYDLYYPANPKNHPALLRVAVSHSRVRNSRGRAWGIQQPGWKQVQVQRKRTQSRKGHILGQAK